MPDRRYDCGALAFADAAGFFVKQDVEAPVQVVFHAPVAAYGRREARGLGGDLGLMKKALLDGRGGADEAMSLDRTDAAQAGCRAGCVSPS